MGYPVYKLIRAINRQYPNNGFINYVDVNENTTNGIIDEDLRDLINEAIHETYINIARDEVYSFPTVAGQNQYQLPEDCDLRDIQEVTRTFRGRPIYPPPGPMPAGFFVMTFNSNGGTGEIEPITVQAGKTFIMPSGPIPPDDYIFAYWVNKEGFAVPEGAEVEATHDEVYTAQWKKAELEVIFMINKTVGSFDDGEDYESEGTTYSRVKVVVQNGTNVGSVPSYTLSAGYQLLGWADSTENPMELWSTEHIEAKPIVQNTIFMAAASVDIDPETLWEEVDNPITDPVVVDAEEWDDDFNFTDNNTDPAVVWQDVSEEEGWDDGFNFGNNVDPTPVWE